MNGGVHIQTNGSPEFPVRFNFELGTDCINLRFFHLDDLEELNFTTDEDGVTIDLTDVGGGTILLAELTTPPDTSDFML